VQDRADTRVDEAVDGLACGAATVNADRPGAGAKLGQQRVEVRSCWLRVAAPAREKSSPTSPTQLASRSSRRNRALSAAYVEPEPGPEVLVAASLSNGRSFGRFAEQWQLR
jgi:hypothetical protein